jgi:hypothetical protein
VDICSSTSSSLCSLRLRGRPLGYLTNRTARAACAHSARGQLRQTRRSVSDEQRRDRACDESALLGQRRDRDNGQALRLNNHCFFVQASSSLPSTYTGARGISPRRVARRSLLALARSPSAAITEDAPRSPRRDPSVGHSSPDHRAAKVSSVTPQQCLARA